MPPVPSDGPRSRSPTANEAFKQTWPVAVCAGVVAAVALHVAFFQAFPSLQAADGGASSDPTPVLQLPDVRVPPPPEPIRRPAAPVVGEPEVDDPETIPPTSGDAFDGPPPPPPVPSAGRDRPEYIPRDVEPRATNDDEIRRLLERHYPPGLRDAGIGGTVTLWLFVDEEGRVAKARIQEPSAYDAFNEAALEVADRMEFRPALDRDRSVGVWVSRRITFRTGR